MIKLRPARAIAAAIAALGAFLAAPAEAKDRFVFAWPSAINSGVAPLTFARKLGYFDAENLDTEIQVLSGSGVIIPQLMSGTVQAAYASLEPIVISRQPGKPNFPLRFVYNYLPRSVWEFAVPRDSPIQSLADMKGKTLGVFALSSGNLYMVRAMLQAAGVSWSDVKLQSVGTGVAAFEALRTGQIHVLNLFDTAHVRLEQSGTAIRRLPVPPQFQELSSHGILVTDALLASKPDLLARFGRALAKGNIACNANLAACINSYWEAYPALRPSSGVEADNRRREIEVLEHRMRNLLHVREGRSGQYGRFADEDWTTLVEALRAGGEVTRTDVPLDAYFTNRLVPEFNRFDVEQVIREARAAP
ncbi:MAG: ABC transporter substrate-binding protein [Rhizobiales bacterium]|nr:ABC transporter substrate-binding protein [Hyphomicrobiales bacterium]